MRFVWENMHFVVFFVNMHLWYFRTCTLLFRKHALMLFVVNMHLCCVFVEHLLLLFSATYTYAVCGERALLMLILW